MKTFHIDVIVWHLPKCLCKLTARSLQLCAAHVGIAAFFRGKHLNHTEAEPKDTLVTPAELWAHEFAAEREDRCEDGQG